MRFLSFDASRVADAPRARRRLAMSRALTVAQSARRNRDGSRVGRAVRAVGRERARRMETFQIQSIDRYFASRELRRRGESEGSPRSSRVDSRAARLGAGERKDGKSPPGSGVGRAPNSKDAV